MERRKSSPYRDSAGKTLADYPRPSVAVDAALLTVVPGEDCLSVLQVQRAEGPGGNPPAGWGLPGTFLHEGELLLDAVQRCLREKAGVDGTRPRQLHVFDKPDRDDRGWVLSVAHMDVVRPELLDGRIEEKTRIVPADDARHSALRPHRDHPAGGPDGARQLRAGPGPRAAAGRALHHPPAPADARGGGGQAVPAGHVQAADGAAAGGDGQDDGRRPGPRPSYSGTGSTRCRRRCARGRAAIPRGGPR